MVDVIGTEEFTAWFQALGEDGAHAVAHAVSRLESMGTALGSPHVHELSTTRLACGLYELTATGTSFRVLFTFERDDRAVLLHGYEAGREGGPRAADSTFFAAHAVVASKIYRRYAAERGSEA
jgi:hypothetical protein